MYANAPAVLGIDVSKTTLVGALLDTHTRQVLWQKSLPNTPAGIAALFQDVAPSAPCVVEPTGRYSHLVVQQGHQTGRTLLLAPTRAAKAFLANLPPAPKLTVWTAGDWRSSRFRSRCAPLPCRVNRWNSFVNA